MSPMLVDRRRIAVAFCAIGAFLHLYAPQAVLPMMARQYEVGAADAGLIITAGTLAVAATAPFTGALSDVIGRKRLIVVAMALLLIPATMTALAPTLNQVIFRRFMHGLLLPPIFAVAIAYIGDVWPPGEANGVFGLYASASAIGGFFWALHPRDADGICRLARRLPGARRLLGDLPRGGGAAADAGAEVRPRHRYRHLAPADGRAPAQPKAARHIRGRLRRAVQFHRHLHLSELSSCRPAVQQIARLPRLDLRGLSRRLGGGAVARPGHRLARAAQLRAGRVGLRDADQPDSLGDRDRAKPRHHLDLRHPHPGLVDKLRRQHRQNRNVRRGRALRDLVLHWRHLRRLAAGAGLRGRRMALVTRAGDRHAV
ncbi:MAG: MFS transporter, partial [Xanthobacteraceae bacterium]|nr:MFS transporter [Xanthobacteraceae bacterium]